MVPRWQSSIASMLWLLAALCARGDAFLQRNAFALQRVFQRASPQSAVSSPVLSPSAGAARWDSACVANPVVLPPINGEPWKMFYYGNDGNWSDGSVGFLPTGTSGLAESADGVAWTKVDGPNADASVFAPSDDVEAWDGLHTGVGDVVRHGDDLLMFYLGAGGAADALGGKSYRGVKMQIGRAVSVDGGVTWERRGSGADGAGPVLEADIDEGLFASWPRILQYESHWRMMYHAFNGTNWRAFTAVSTDAGLTWTDRTLALDTGAEGAFDEVGVGTRAVVKRGGDDVLMVYEGVEAGTGTHRLGAATSSDGGASWTRAAGPIVEPGVAPLGDWTAQVVGTPYLVGMDDGSLRLYHCAKTKETNMSIGVLVSPSGAFDADAWRGVD